MGENHGSKSCPLWDFPHASFDATPLHYSPQKGMKETGPGIGSKQAGRLPAQCHMAEHWRGEDSDQYVLILEFLLLCMPTYLLPSL